MKSIKYSRQREAILNFLKTRKDHPTAETIYSNIREIYPNLSIGTVYRNLNLLSENGEILKISLEDDSAHFDGFTQPHCHFFCKKCKTLSDIEISRSNMASIEKFTKENFDGEIHLYSSVFYGLCKKCIENDI
ncbi:MAG: transcriptional repressor [Lachnospiraceae bacterium]|nr:transcriptional repressor [Lachnospiraceae bacterium]